MSVLSSDVGPYRCPVTATMSLIGGKWKLIILWCISNEINRFGKLQRAIPDISKKMLTAELRALERDGIISRTIYPVMPPSVEYRMTALGETLLPMMNIMAQWGIDYALAQQDVDQQGRVQPDFVTVNE